MDLFLPVLALGAAGWLVPWALGRLLPEGVGWLILNGICSFLLLAGLAALGFALLYGEAGGAVWRAAPWHFLVLSGRSAVIWAPVAMLSLANLPRGWAPGKW